MQFLRNLLARAREARQGMLEKDSVKIGGPVGSAWREQVLTRVAEQRAMLDWLLASPDQPNKQAQDFAAAARRHLDAARDAVEIRQKKVRRRARASIGGATVERASGHLDAVECHLLRLATHDVRRGQLPSLLAHVRRHLEVEDPRRVAVEQLATRAPSDPWHDTDRERVLAALHAASSQARREVRQIRSFRNTLVATAIALTIAAGVMGVVGGLSPASIPMCFHPVDLVVCPTSTTSVIAKPPLMTVDEAHVDAVMRTHARPGDVALIELLGVIAAALSAALADVPGDVSNGVRL
jgi:hypothetical protein